MHYATQHTSAVRSYAHPSNLRATGLCPVLHTGTIPPELGELVALESLDLSSNGLNGKQGGLLRLVIIEECPKIADFPGFIFLGVIFPVFFCSKWKS